MAETWEQTKARLKKQGINLQADIVVIEPPKPPTPKREETKAEKPEPLYEIRKVTLPPDKKREHGKVVVYGVTAKEANWWIEFRLKPKVYDDDNTESKTLVFYEKFLIDGTPRERNIYSNPARFCTEDFPEFGNPRRIN
jgi:hypothetical protein